MVIYIDISGQLLRSFYRGILPFPDCVRLLQLSIGLLYKAITYRYLYIVK